MDSGVCGVRVAARRLILREHALSDLDAPHALFTDGRLTYYMPSMRRETREETLIYLRSVMRDGELPNRLRYNLAVERDGEMIGSVGLHVIDIGSDGAHYGLGYFIRPDLWNLGYAAEAARAAVDFIFRANACRVSASCLAENLASRRVLEKCGMVQEGLLKAHTWHDGQWKDCTVYRILKAERGGIPECSET